MLDGAGLAKLILSQPALLGLVVDFNLEPTLDFYKACIGYEESKQLLMRDPALLTVSLQE